MFELMVHNREGASWTYPAESLEEAKRMIGGWYDPDNVSVKIFETFEDDAPILLATKAFDSNEIEEI